MNLERQRIRENDPTGAPHHFGFIWDEPIPGRERLIKVTIYTAGYTALAIFPFALYFYKHHDPLKAVATIDFTLLSIFWGCVIIVAVMLAMMPFKSFDRWLTQQAGVSFSSTDEIWLTRPRRLFQPYPALDWFCIVPPASEVTSIEMTAMKNRIGGHYRHGGDDGYLAYCVHIHFVSGKRIRVGEYFTENEAYIVVAQLNSALREARTAMKAAA